MEDAKLEQLSRRLIRRILVAEGQAHRVLKAVLNDVRKLMGRDVEIDPKEDPVFWFDRKGRFCTRAQTKEEIQDSMIIMGIADGVDLIAALKEDPQCFDRARDWTAFQEMKCKYLEALMRIRALEEELKEERYRHDRYVDFELAQAEELRKAREALQRKEGLL